MDGRGRELSLWSASESVREINAAVRMVAGLEPRDQPATSGSTFASQRSDRMERNQKDRRIAMVVFQNCCRFIRI